MPPRPGREHPATPPERAQGRSRYSQLFPCRASDSRAIGGFPEYATASEVSAEVDVGGRTPWQRVTAVSVCVLVRSVANGRQEDKADSVRSFTDCRGETIELPSGNRYVYKIYQRVFAVRNNLSAQL